MVSGPSDSGNGSLDYDSSAAITGGTFIAMGSTGMAQAFDSTSTQAQVSATVTGSAGDQVSIVDSSGNVVISATARSAYGLVLASSADLSEGSEYSVYIGGTPTDADSNGVATSGTLSGGSQSTTATASLSLQLSGTMGGGGMGGTGTTGGGNTGGMGGGTTGNSGGSGNMGGSAPGGGSRAASRLVRRRSRGGEVRWKPRPPRFSLSAGAARAYRQRGFLTVLVGQQANGCHSVPPRSPCFR